MILAFVDVEQAIPPIDFLDWFSFASSITTIIALVFAIFVYFKWREQRISNKIFDLQMEAVEQGYSLKFACINLANASAASDIYRQNLELKEYYSSDSWDKDNYTTYRIRYFELLASYIAKLEALYIAKGSFNRDVSHLREFSRLVSHHIAIAHSAHSGLSYYFLSPNQKLSTIIVKLYYLPTDPMQITKLKYEFNARFEKNEDKTDNSIICKIHIESFDTFWDDVTKIHTILFHYHLEQITSLLRKHLNLH